MNLEKLRRCYLNLPIRHHLTVIMTTYAEIVKRGVPTNVQVISPSAVIQKKEADIPQLSQPTQLIPSTSTVPPSGAKPFSREVLIENNSCYRTNSAEAPSLLLGGYSCPVNQVRTLEELNTVLTFSDAYEYALIKCVTRPQIGGKTFFHRFADSVVAETSCYNQIIYFTFYPDKIKTSIFSAGWTQVKVILNLIPTVPEFFWSLLHHSIPPWNETVYAFCPYVIAFYCDVEGDQTIHNHTVYIDSHYGNVGTDGTDFCWDGRSCFYKAMELRRSWKK